MKKVILSVFICLMCTPVFSQWTSNGNIISTTQNVGVGTTAPAYKLDVNGDVRSNNVVLSPDGQISPLLSSKFTYKGLSMGNYALGWMADSWNSIGNSLWQSAYGGIKFFTGGQFQMSIHNSGNVGIGTEAPTQKLDVNGNIKGTNFYANGTVFANEVKVEATKWSDFVFDKEYKLLPLEEVKAHIEEHKHLPDVPSEKQVLEEGIDVAEMQAKLLQKIEELTLYVIQQDAKNKALEQEMKELKASLSKE